MVELHTYYLVFLRSRVLILLDTYSFPSYTTSTEMTVHRKTFDELSSNEFFWGGTIPSNWIG